MHYLPAVSVAGLPVIWQHMVDYGPLEYACSVGLYRRVNVPERTWWNEIVVVVHDPIGAWGGKRIKANIRTILALSDAIFLSHQPQRHRRIFSITEISASVSIASSDLSASLTRLEVVKSRVDSRHHYSVDTLFCLRISLEPR